jgi:hypothetical protein
VITSTVQRWRDRRDAYRPAGELIETSAYEVAPLEGEGSDTTARAFVERHHYSGSYPAARRRFGLYRAAELVGVAVFSQPQRDAVVTGVLPGTALDSLVLGRFVLLDNVPGNGETWFLGRAFELLRREEFRGVVSFSDPEPRANAAGAVVFGGHVGTIYQAHNATYLGRRSKRETRILLPDGTVFDRRTMTKIAARVAGGQPALELLVRHGARRPAPGEDLEQWVTEAVSKVGRPALVQGNHKYVWALDKRTRRALPASLPYPKLERETTRRAA